MFICWDFNIDLVKKMTHVGSAKLIPRDNKPKTLMFGMLSQDFTYRFGKKNIHNNVLLYVYGIEPLI